MSREVTNLLYLVTIVTFILALRFLSNPATARRGNQIGAAGMLVAKTDQPRRLAAQAGRLLSAGAPAMRRADLTAVVDVDPQSL